MRLLFYNSTRTLNSGIIGEPQSVDLKINVIDPYLEKLKIAYLVKFQY